MTNRGQAMCRRLSVLIDGLEDIRWDDVAAWSAAAAEVGKLVRGARGVLPEAGPALKAAAGGLKRLAAGTAVNRLAVVTALGGLMAAVHSAVEAGKADDEGLQEAAARLAEALDPPGPAAGPAEAAPAPGGRTATVEDAASLLIRLEADDRDGWRRLAAMLAEILEENGGGVAFRNRLESAAALCAGLAAGAADDPQGRMADIGRLLDAALNGEAPEAGETRGAEAERAPAPAPLPETGGEAVCAEPAGPDEIDYMPAGADGDLLGEFVAESRELIQNAEEALLALEHDPGDMEAVGKVFRAFHTVKGTAGFLELKLISELGHHAETLLSRVREGEIRYSGGYADLSLQALDTIKQLVAGVGAALCGGALRKPEGYDRLLAVLKNPEAAGVSEAAAEGPAPRVGDLLVAQGKAERDRVEAALARHPGDPAGLALVKTDTAGLVDVGQALRAQQKLRAGGAVEDASVRVSTQRLDRLIDMVGELVIAHSMVAQELLGAGARQHGLAKKVAHTSKIVRELQDITMSMRMVPLKATFGKMARVARDVARKLGKTVAFVTEGEETEIDRNLVDVVNDPLVHMVRNAVDHGIEAPAERRAAGKPEQGTVKIAAYHSAGSVVVEISDDGKGLDRDVLLAKARERGLVAEGAEPSDREVYNLIFAPGFSTAPVVTDVSGRGVGMDVVKKNVERLRGTVEIRSEKGVGSVFRMSLPLTLAIIDGMVIRVGRETYVVPTVSITRSVKPSAQEIATVFGEGEMLRLQGGLLPLCRLARIFGVAGAGGEPSEGIVVVVEDEGRRAGLVVDALVGRQQVVIKSLGETMKNIPGIAGGAIMPDGRVGLILDVAGLLRFALPERRDGHRDEGPGPKARALAA